MAHRGKVLLCIAVAVLGAQYVCHPTFVPPAVRPSMLRTMPAVAMLGSAPVFADEIGDAATKLAKESWPFMKEVDWNSGLYLCAPGKFQPEAALKAVDKAIQMGAAMDPALLKKAVLAHHNAIVATDQNGLTSQALYEQTLAAIGRIVASVPESSTMDVYNAFSGIVDSGVPNYLMSTVKEADARKAYDSFLQFKDVVKAHPIQVAAPQSTLSETAANKIGEAATKLSEASYPLLKDVDWSSDLFLKPLPGQPATQVVKAIDKALVMGAAMDSKYLKQAAEAHHAAILDVDAKGVTSMADYQAINAALGKAIAAVPTSKVMDVYNQFAKVISPDVGNKLYSTVNPLDAQQAYRAFLDFKDVVKAAQR